MWSGAWKSFDEVEENLTVDQLMLIIKHSRKRDSMLHKIIMASAGAEVDFDDDDSSEANDITDLKGGLAASEGFGIGFGLEYSVE
jgi:hypothetical protein